MCKFLLSLFKPKLVLPHPQEPINKQPVTDYEKCIDDWLTRWAVPPEYWSFWLSRPVIITTDVPCAQTTQDLTSFNPYWLSPGIVAHEFCHISYGLLSEVGKSNFSIESSAFMKTDPLIKLLFKTNAYGLTNDAERHAEIGRYIGDRMPESLKIYYPRMY